MHVGGVQEAVLAEAVVEGDLHLAVAAHAARRQQQVESVHHPRAHEERVKDILAAPFALQIAHAQQEVLHQLAVELEVEGQAAGVLDVFHSISEAGDVGGNAAGEVAVNHQGPPLQLLEGADVERHLVVKETNAAAQERAVVVRENVGEAEARRNVALVAQGAVVVPRPEVEGQPPPRAPLVLEPEGVLGLVAADEGRAGERVPLEEEEPRGRGLNVNRSAGMKAAEGAAGDVQAQPQQMLAARLARPEVVHLLEFVAPGDALLGVEEAPENPLGKEEHPSPEVGRVDVHVVVLDAEGGLEQRPVGEKIAVLQPRHPALLAAVGGDFLRVEGVQVGVAVLLRVGGENPGEEMILVQGEVELGEAVEAFELGVLLRHGEARDRRAHEAVLERLHNREAVLDDGPAHGEARRERLDAAQAALASARPREEVLQAVLPLVAGARGLDGGDGAGELAVLGVVGVREDFDFLDDVARQVDGPLAGDRVGDVRAIDQPPGLRRGGALDLDEPVGAAHDAGHERQCVLETLADERGVLQSLLAHRALGRGLLGLDALGFGADFDFGAHRLELHLESELEERPGFDGHLARCVLVAFERDRERVEARRQAGEVVGAVVGGRGFIAPARVGLGGEHELRARQEDRLAVGRRGARVAVELPRLLGDSRGRPQRGEQEEEKSWESASAQGYLVRPPGHQPDLDAVPHASVQSLLRRRGKQNSLGAFRRAVKEPRSGAMMAGGSGGVMAAYTEKHARAGVKARLPKIETWENQFPGYAITITIPEYTAVCPRTGQPDFGTLTLRYQPRRRCLELKSLKMYILAYRDLGIFYENAVNRILRDVVAACRPVWAEVRGEFTPRGGMRATVEARYPRGRRNK